MDEAPSLAAEPPLPPSAVAPFVPSPAPRSRHLWQGAASVLALIVVAVIVGGLLIKVPYVALTPGSARDTEDLVEVEGASAFPSEGELLFTTVRVQTRPNLWEYLWLDTVAEDVEIVPEEVILQNRSPDENRSVQRPRTRPWSAERRSASRSSKARWPISASPAA